MDYLGRPTKRIRREAVVTLEAADVGNSDSLTALQAQLYGDIKDLEDVDMSLQEQVDDNELNITDNNNALLGKMDKVVSSDLDIGGFDIVNASTISTDRLNVHGLSVTESVLPSLPNTYTIGTLGVPYKAIYCDAGNFNAQVTAPAAPTLGTSLVNKEYTDLLVNSYMKKSASQNKG